MKADFFDQFSRLERQIMEAVYRLGSATVAAVVDEVGDPDTSESIRVTMSMLEKKGFLTHTKSGVRNLYRPTVPESEARASVVEKVLRTFFADSPRTAILNLLDREDTGLTETEVSEVRRLIKSAEDAQGFSSEA